MKQQRDRKRRWKGGLLVLVAGPLVLLAAVVTLRWMTPEVRGDGVAHPPPLTFEVAAAEGPSELAGSETCERCHADIVAQWSTSAHRYSGLENPWYRGALEDFQQERGVAAGRWCAGCHTPALLLSGQAERPVAEMAPAAAGDPTANGVSCLACHGMTRVDSRLGQGDYEIGQLGVMHDLATSDNPIVRGVHDLLVRVDPEPHRRTYSRPLLETSEFCASCHAAHFDEPINGYRRFKYFDDYATWQGSQVSGQSLSSSLGQGPPGAPRDCVDCHMAPMDGAALDDGALSHRFAAANTALPTYHGAPNQLRAVEEFLTAGRVSVDLFALRIPTGAEEAVPPVRDRFEAPLDRGDIALHRGETVLLDVVVSNRDVGHGFPGGKLDLHDIWLEVRAVDETGRTVFWSGRVEEGGAIEPTAHRYGMLYANEKGQRIDHHQMWRGRADLWRNVIYAGDSQVVRYRLEAPDTGEELELSVRLRHRKFRPEFTARVFADLGQTPPVMPVLTLAEDSLRLPLRDRPEGALASDSETNEVEASESQSSDSLANDMQTVERWRAYGIGLAGRFERQPAQEAFRRLLEIAPEDAHGRMALGWLLGPSRPEGQAELEAALEMDDNLPLAHVLLATAAGDDPARALELLRRGTENHPHDADLRVRIGNLLFQQNDFAAALDEYEAAFTAAPETAGAHYGLMRTLTALGDHQRAREHQAWYSFLRTDRDSMRWSMDYFDANPDDAIERQRGHLHHSVPLREPGVSESDQEVSP